MFWKFRADIGCPNAILCQAWNIVFEDLRLICAVHFIRCGVIQTEISDAKEHICFEPSVCPTEHGHSNQPNNDLAAQAAQVASETTMSGPRKFVGTTPSIQAFFPIYRWARGFGSGGRRKDPCVLRLDGDGVRVST